MRKFHFVYKKSGKPDKTEKGEASSGASVPYKISTEFSLGQLNWAEIDSFYIGDTKVTNTCLYLYLSCFARTQYQNFLVALNTKLQFISEWIKKKMIFTAFYHRGWVSRYT